MAHASVAVCDTDMWNSSQTWVAVQTFTVAPHLFRARIFRNVHDSQSSATLDRWNGSEWSEVMRLPMSAMPEGVQALSRVPRIKGIAGEVEAALQAGLEVLHERALRFAGAIETTTTCAGV